MADRYCFCLKWNWVISVVVFISFLFTWKAGSVANLSPEDGGYVGNRWNSDQYCCLWRYVKECIYYSIQDGANITLCEARFNGPDFAKNYCKKGDKYPDCIAKTLYTKHSYYVSMIGHMVSLFLLVIKGKTLSGFLIYVIFLQVNF